MCALDFSIQEVSIAEKISLRHALSTPGKQMCRTGQAQSPDQLLWSQTLNCDHRLIEGQSDFVRLPVCASTGLSIEECHLYCEPCCDLSLKTWAGLHYDVVVMLSAYVFGVTGRARGPEHLFLVETKICISSPVKKFRLPVPENAGYSRLVWS